MGRTDASKPPCTACVMGGTVKRLANRATHVVVFGDGMTALACAMHAQQYAGGAGFAFEIDGLPGFMWAPKTDVETREALRFATYDRREGNRQSDRDARTVVVKIQVEDATGKPLPPG